MELTAADMREQEIYDAGYRAGAASREQRIRELEEQLQMYRQDHRDRSDLSWRDQA